MDKIYQSLEKAQDNGLYYNYINPINGIWCRSMKLTETYQFNAHI